MEEENKTGNIRGGVPLIIFFTIFCGMLIYGGFFFYSLKSAYFAGPYGYIKNGININEQQNENIIIPTPTPAPFHIKTPEPVKAIYMTSWVAGTTDWREDMVSLINKTKLNSLIIDVKDYTGRISFEATDPYLVGIGASENRIPDIKEFINYLHKNNIYVIARISVFQDPFMVGVRPDLAVKKETGGVWKDYKGISWIDPGAKEYWDYIVKISKESERVGFDELNFDYIRFPSDGNMKNISYDFWDEVTPKRETMAKFYEYLRLELDELDVALSADLFGMTTSNSDDLNIGQILEDAAKYFDYVSPMVYPSHYPKTFRGFANPAEHPYEVVLFAMESGVAKLKNASTSPLKLRPWLQDFDMGATYDGAMIRKQMQAVYDAGLDSWMLWDPANRYTRSALD